MLLVAEGYFDAGRFISNTPIKIPDKKKVIVTILDESSDEINEESMQAKLWSDIFDEIENCTEVLYGEPERIHFKTPEETGSL